MSWEDQSGLHKGIKKTSVAFFHMTFALPALLSLMLLAHAGLRFYQKGRWETPSLLKFLRDLNPSALESFNGVSSIAANIPLWLASLTLSLLIFAWSAQKSE